jgi:gentisate 1,2-dioxygenase
MSYYTSKLSDIGDPLYFEYSKAADPVGSGLTPQVPVGDFPSSNHLTGNTKIVSFDKSKELKTNYPATTPCLLANYIKILPNESVTTNPNATSEVYYCIRGKGTSEIEGEQTLSWKKGDFMTIPMGSKAVHTAEEDTAFYWVHDEPLLTYLGAKAVEKRFAATLFPAETCSQELEKALQQRDQNEPSRIAVLLANSAFPQTRTITHTLWTMYGILPRKSIQLPHRHNSVAIDFIISCPSHGCYTLMGDELDEKGNIKNPIRAEWKSESTFITPPYQWHSHHNESDEDAFLIPLQDAGLQTYLRTLDIQFFKQGHQVLISREEPHKTKIC